MQPTKMEIISEQLNILDIAVTLTLKFIKTSPIILLWIIVFLLHVVNMVCYAMIIQWSLDKELLLNYLIAQVLK